MSDCRAVRAHVPLQSYEKVSRGMWWNDFYRELMHQHDLPHWDENATCKAKPVTVDDYLPLLGVRYAIKGSGDK